MRISRPFFLVSVLPLLHLAVFASSAGAQQLPAVNRGVDYLRSQSSRQGAGESALGALAMLKAEVPKNDPALVACIARIDSRFNGSVYRPERSGGTEIYEAGLVIMALVTLDANGRKAQINSVAQYIISQQRPNGSWDYSGRNQGDCSISQYATLGLWEAENAGAPVPGRVWDQIASFFMSVQGASGGFNYHRDEANYPDTLSMTGAGVGSLLICERQLAQYRKNVAVQSQYLIPVLSEAQKQRYAPVNSSARIINAANNGINWIAANFNINNATLVGPSPFYMLYGVERLGALAGRQNLGRIDWYNAGANFISSKQGADGSLSSAHGEYCNTAWGVLFLVRATKKTVERITIRRLGAGELFGGMGLPQDLSSISVAAGRVVARPMDGAVEGMLTVLEDPRAANAESALAGLVTRYQTMGTRALLPYRDRFQKLLTDQDPGVRKVAAWAFGRMNDVANVPYLIQALEDPDEGVMNEARAGLRILSRKIEGYGPPNGATAEQRAEAAKAWRAWYLKTRPLTIDQDDTSLDGPSSAPSPARPAGATSTPAPSATPAPSPAPKEVKP